MTHLPTQALSLQTQKALRLVRMMKLQQKRAGFVININKFFILSSEFKSRDNVDKFAFGKQQL